MPIKPSTPTLDSLMAELDHLPQPPDVALKLTRLLENASASAEQLAQVIQVDIHLTAQVLRVCNSSAYGLNRKIETIKEAIAMLGFAALKSMVYTVISQGTLNTPLHGYDLGKGVLWQNAAACALYAKHLAVRVGQCDAELAYTGSILRDIGKLVLSQHVGQHFLSIESKAINEQLDFEAAEASVLGFSHTQIGEKVAEKWSLPDSLKTIIRYHHKPSAIPDDVPLPLKRVTAVVHLADTFTLMLGCGLGCDGLMYGLDTEGLEKAQLRLCDGEFETLYAELLDMNQRVKGLVESFGAN